MGSDVDDALKEIKSLAMSGVVAPKVEIGFGGKSSVMEESKDLESSRKSNVEIISGLTNKVTNTTPSNTSTLVPRKKKSNLKKPSKIDSSNDNKTETDVSNNNEKENTSLKSTIDSGVQSNSTATTLLVKRKSPPVTEDDDVVQPAAKQLKIGNIPNSSK